MAETSIEWTDFSINPIRARLGDAVGHYCEKVSPGCANCYASRLQKRFGMPEYKGTSFPGGAEPFLDELKLREVLRRTKPTKFFWCDMTDLFGPWVSDEWVTRCVAVMAMTPQHTHQVLTKRPHRMLDYFTRLGHSIAPLEAVAREMGHSFKFPTGDGRDLSLLPWPIPNVWLGVSVEDQVRAEERIPPLLQTPAAVRFLSCEPLLGSVVLPDANRMGLRPWKDEPWFGLDWVIVGGESGPGARPMDVAWARSLVRQCADAGVACFVKQLGADVVCDGITGGGEHWPDGKRTSECARLPGRDSLGWRVKLSDRKGGDPAEWPEDLRVRQFPGVPND